MVCLCVLLKSVCESMCCSVFVFLSHSYQSTLCLNLISHVWLLWVCVCAHAYTHICLNEGGAWLSNLQPSEQAGPTPVALSSAAESGHWSWPWGHTSPHCCVESPGNMSQSSSFVQGRGLATPHATSTCVPCTVGPDGAQLHPGLGSDVRWAMRPGLGLPEPLCIVCAYACAYVPHRKSLGGFPNSWGAGRGAEEEEVTPLHGAQETSAQGQPGPKDMRPWGASLVINREVIGFHGNISQLMPEPSLISYLSSMAEPFLWVGL